MAGIQVYFSLSIPELCLLDNCFKYAEMSIEKKEGIAKKPLNKLDEYFLRWLKATRQKIMGQAQDSTSDADVQILGDEMKKMSEITQEFVKVMEDADMSILEQVEAIFRGKSQ